MHRGRISRAKDQRCAPENATLERRAGETRCDILRERDEPARFVKRMPRGDAASRARLADGDLGRERATSREYI